MPSWRGDRCRRDAALCIHLCNTDLSGSLRPQVKRCIPPAARLKSSPLSTSSPLGRVNPPLGRVNLPFGWVTPSSGASVEGTEDVKDMAVGVTP
eukprot:838199-Pyramimonas_sp.AAC.1